MVQGARGANTVGSKSFLPDQFLEQQVQLGCPQHDDLQKWVITAFNLDPNDDYVYRAGAEVTLAQVQRAIAHGGSNGLHAWYLDSEGKQIPSPPKNDVDAYVNVFASTTSTSKALIALEKNAKKGSIRSRVAANLITKRLLPESLIVPKLKKSHINPYFDIWAWSCKNLEWAGPDEATVNLKQSHHILPVLYHHFGCVCPSFESIEIIRQISKGREVLDIGSGNGYWTYMLRRAGLRVRAVDNGDSLWRTSWIEDTTIVDGAKFLNKESGAKDAVLLLVYPQVTTSFTRSVLKSYQGSTICIAGTQNRNGFTAFENMMVDEYISREKPKFDKVIQTPLPSFAGKDEALFFFEARP